MHYFYILHTYFAYVIMRQTSLISVYSKEYRIVRCLFRCIRNTVERNTQTKVLQTKQLFILCWMNENEPHSYGVRRIHNWHKMPNEPNSMTVWNQYNSFSKGAHYSGLLRVLHPFKWGFLSDVMVREWFSLFISFISTARKLVDVSTFYQTHKKGDTKYWNTLNTVRFDSISSFLAMIMEILNWNYAVNGKINFMLLNKQLKEDISCLVSVFAHSKKKNICENFYRMDRSVDVHSFGEKGVLWIVKNGIFSKSKSAHSVAFFQF